MMFLRLAWRNVWRNTRRTFITLSAISFGLASMIVFFALTDGFHSQWVENTVRLSSGHVQIHASGYQRRPDVKKSFSPGPLMKILGAMREVKGLSPRVEIRGLASTAETSSAALILGIDPDDRSGITDLRESIASGGYSLRGKGAIIGQKLAQRLRASIGDKVVITAQTASGALGSELFRVRGIFRSGSVDFDSSVILVSLKSATGLTELRGRVTGIAVLTRSSGESEELRERLLSLPELRGYEVLDWQEQIPMLKQGIEGDNALLYFIFFIILVVVSFGIINAVLMSILERTKELGIMMSMGTRPGRIMAMIVFEAAFVAIVGVLLGTALGISASALLAVRGVNLAAWTEAMELFAVVKPVIYPEIIAKGIVLSIAVVFVTAVLSSLYPAVRAARLKPVEAMRYV